jgi:hypothetical protein
LKSAIDEKAFARAAAALIDVAKTMALLDLIGLAGAASSSPASA